MKRVMVLTGILCVVFLAGCRDNNSPSQVFRQFFAAVEINDAAALARVATEGTVEMIEMIGPEFITGNGPIQSITEEIYGDEAVVTVTFENGEIEEFDLVRVDGNWKVSLGK